MATNELVKTRFVSFTAILLIRKEEYRSKARELKVELATQQARGQEEHLAAMKKPEKKEASAGSMGNVEDKMKKFLGFGKKK